MKKDKRARLSIDLDAHPDIRDMLAAAAEATKQSPSTITIMSLRKQLPIVVQEIRDDVNRGVSKFMQAHGISLGRPPEEAKAQEAIDEDEDLQNKMKRGKP